MAKTRKYRKRKCVCVKKCKVKKIKKRCCKKCVKRKCPCVRLPSRKTRRTKKTRRPKTKRRRRRVRKQRGGKLACHMGEVFTGTKMNNYNLKGSLYPVSTQNHVPLKGGGLFSQRAIDFGLGNALTFTRDGVNHLTNLKQTWYGDRHVDSADPVIAGRHFNKE